MPETRLVNKLKNTGAITDIIGSQELSETAAAASASVALGTGDLSITAVTIHESCWPKSELLTVAVSRMRAG